MLKDCLTSLRVIALTAALCAVGYPLAVLTFAAIVTPETRQGSLVTDRSGRVIGSRLIAQPFTRPEYFWPRPSACGYNAAGAGGSNLSPGNPKLTDRARQEMDRLAPAADAPIAADLVTTSGSGLDPHITQLAAENQIARIARARGMSENALQQLIASQVHSLPFSKSENGRLLNVLELNMALDVAASTK